VVVGRGEVPTVLLEQCSWRGAAGRGMNIALASQWEPRHAPPPPRRKGGGHRAEIARSHAVQYDRPILRIRGTEKIEVGCGFHGGSVQSRTRLVELSHIREDVTRQST